MVALRVLDIKKCMNYMLATGAFDAWEVAEIKITAKVSYVIDGHLTPDFLSPEEMDAENLLPGGCVSFGNLRPLCFEMIKGKRTPHFFRFSFLCPREQMKEMITGEQLRISPEDIVNLTMNITFHQGELLVTTSCLERSFSLDKTLAHAWDSWVLDFFRKMEIAVEKTS
ncbi:MAG: DUF5721 family protein [Lachnospiraceae bacterium]|nr:DUF5721 family protein [Lachnospiraceae bacterium]